MARRTPENIPPKVALHLGQGAINPLTVINREVQNQQDSRFPQAASIEAALRSTAIEGMQWQFHDLTLVVEKTTSETCLKTDRRYTQKSPYLLTVRSGEQRLIIYVYNGQNKFDMAIINHAAAIQPQLQTAVIPQELLADTVCTFPVIPLDISASEAVIKDTLTAHCSQLAATEALSRTANIPDLAAAPTDAPVIEPKDTDATHLTAQEVIPRPDTVTTLTIRDKKIFASFMERLRTALGPTYTVSELQDKLHFDNQVSLSTLSITNPAGVSITAVLVPAHGKLNNYNNFLDALERSIFNQTGISHAFSELNAYFQDKAIAVLLAKSFYHVEPEGPLMKNIQSAFMRQEVQLSQAHHETITSWTYIERLQADLRKINGVIAVQPPEQRVAVDDKPHLCIDLTLEDSSIFTVVLYPASERVNIVPSLYSKLHAEGTVTETLSTFLYRMYQQRLFIIIDHQRMVATTVLELLTTSVQRVLTEKIISLETAHKKLSPELLSLLVKFGFELGWKNAHGQQDFGGALFLFEKYNLFYLKLQKAGELYKLLLLNPSHGETQISSRREAIEALAASTNQSVEKVIKYLMAHNMIVLVGSGKFLTIDSVAELMQIAQWK